MHIFLIHSTDPTYNIAVSHFKSQSRRRYPSLTHLHCFMPWYRSIIASNILYASYLSYFYLFSFHTIISLLLLFPSRTFIFHFVLIYGDLYAVCCACYCLAVCFVVDISMHR
ncbi:hypothetical protein DFJ58DRAFT_210856 [Suillus subalutaceus]|uniref:uncharacterized protein n=1 Tax=Suillus subalutaceus TaxID=48586 RepID=UPI001B85C5CE|nr:uncharacterized protein DFJ58DRAFT_210856 [Suillus subalutaceus]KAG1834988.1 hypothetical protein DFJ58DRAFT_210856 [Suillus subalutaceus]